MISNIEAIPAFSDNYIWILINGNSAAVVDPGDASAVDNFLNENDLNLESILITHHHHDHTSGVLGLLKEYPDAQIYSPSELFSLTINKITDEDKIKTSLNEFQVFSTPGHTLDHVALCDTKNNLLFVLSKKLNY